MKDINLASLFLISNTTQSPTGSASLRVLLTAGKLLQGGSTPSTILTQEPREPFQFECFFCAASIRCLPIICTSESYQIAKSCVKKVSLRTIGGGLAATFIGTTRVPKPVELTITSGLSVNREQPRSLPTSRLIGPTWIPSGLPTNCHLTAGTTLLSTATKWASKSCTDPNAPSIESRWEEPLCKLQSYPL